MAGVWSHRFAIVLRPLRDKSAPETTVYIETRTAAQASREAMALHPEMKVLGVTRADGAQVTNITSPAPRVAATPAAPVAEVTVLPFRKAGNG